MALIVNSIEIPQSGAVNFNSTALKQVNHGSVLVWTSTPDPITIMSTGKSIGSWLGGGVLGSDAGYQVFSMASQGTKNTTNGNIQAHGGIDGGNLYFGGQESTIGGNRSLIVSNFTVNTKGFKVLQISYIIKQDRKNDGGAPWAAIGPSGWNETKTAQVSLPNVTSQTGSVNLNLTNYQGTYAIKFGMTLQGNVNNDPYQAGRYNRITRIYMYG